MISTPYGRAEVLDHRVSLDLLTGKRTDSFTVIFDDQEAPHRVLGPVLFKKDFRVCFP